MSATHINGNICCACGGTPRVSKDGRSIIPLKRCARCQQVWYHDIDCQKRHYVTHKKDCRRWAQNRTASIARVPDETIPDACTLKVRVEPRSGRGNCLVASQQILKGERITPGLDNVDYWDPLVLPVLLEHQRRIRCTLCFGVLDPSIEPYCYEPSGTPACQAYLLFFCSSRCRELGRNHGLEKEQATVSRLFQRRGHVKIFPTAVLLFRLLRSSMLESVATGVVEQFSRLQSTIPETFKADLDDASYHHSRAVIVTVLELLELSGYLSKFQGQISAMEDMVNRIKINGFSVADGENVAMGIGIFLTPSFINHSCRPNTIQTFLYGQNNRPPRLILTSHENISADQEVLISYIDNSCPRHLRHYNLERGYFFSCDCNACVDPSLDTEIIGLRCLHCSNSEQAVQVVGSFDLRCRTCQATDFESQVKILRSLEKADEKADVHTLEKSFQNVQQLCRPGSWYLEESGDRLVHALLDELGQATTIVEQERLAIQALTVLQVLDPNAGTTTLWTSSGQEFRRSIRLFQAAKLRLFLEPNPFRAIELLEKAYSFLSLYYPADHELLKDMSKSMREAKS